MKQINKKVEIQKKSSRKTISNLEQVNLSELTQ